MVKGKPFKVNSVPDREDIQNLKSNTTFKILQVNLQSIRNKLLELEIVCKNNNIDIVCVSEHWLLDEEVNLYIPSGYVSASYFCRKIRKNGGVSIFVKEGIHFEPVDLSQFNSEMDCELCCARFNKQNITVVSVYRSPQGDINTFFLF